MAANKIDSTLLQMMFVAGAKSLESKKEWINELNVFPVPDGDTGTNMTLTIMSAAREVVSLAQPDMPTLCKAISSGSLRGARGNSGVILSQLLRGFTKVVKEYEEIDIEILCTAMQRAVETAYKAVMKPKEGTILTVARGMAEMAVKLQESKVTDMKVFLQKVLEEGDATLARTPELLPVLKQAGVVDSGGQGLMEALRGAMDAFNGKEVDFNLDGGTANAGVATQAKVNIKYEYNTEFMIRLDKPFNIKNEIDFKEYLETIGESVRVSADENAVKVRICTNDPGFAIQRALKYGSLTNIQIDNLKFAQEKLQQTNENAKPISGSGTEAACVAQSVPEERKPFGFISVSVGNGISEIFTGLGVDCIIEGGQTMNPSTEDMLNAIAKVNADTIFILPNNKNIVLAANQAASLTEDKKVIVIPTKTIPQGITAAVNFVPDASAEENQTVMEEEAERVKSGEVTYAVRDTVIDEKEIHQGDFMGIGDRGILAVGTQKDAVTLDMIRNMIDEDSELISIYYGCDVTEDEAEALRASVESTFDSCDVELQQGGQPIYSYIVSVE